MENNQALRAIEQRVFFIEDHKYFKTMLLTPDAIRFCSKKTTDPHEFTEAFENAHGKTLTMTSTAHVPYSDIKRFTHLSNSGSANISYNGIKLSWPGVIKTPDGATDIHNIFTYLEKVQGFRRSEQQLGVFKAILPNLGYTALACGLTWLMYGMASGTMESSSSSGYRTRAKAEIFQAIADMLGPAGSLIIGFAAIGLAAWFLFKKLQNPPIQTKLEY
ncbi:MAG: hypothetical protein JNJ57_04080 [Saprospiraceae bacterium]|nr:hypothetical protein [Saprospiraceae bacterium]